MKTLDSEGRRAMNDLPAHPEAWSWLCDILSVLPVANRLGLDGSACEGAGRTCTVSGATPLYVIVAILPSSLTLWPWFQGATRRPGARLMHALPGCTMPFPAYDSLATPALG